MSNYEFNSNKNMKKSTDNMVAKVGGFFKRHKTKILVGTTVVVVAGVAYYVYVNHRGERIEVKVPDVDVDPGNIDTNDQQ